MFRAPCSRVIPSRRTLSLITQRRTFIVDYGYKVAKGMMPKISDTERAALNAGTVGFDGNIFTGNPSVEDLSKYAIPSSPDEESTFCF